MGDGGASGSRKETDNNKQTSKSAITEAKAKREGIEVVVVKLPPLAKQPAAPWWMVGVLLELVVGSSVRMR